MPITKDRAYLTNMDRLAAEIESVMHSGRNLVRESTQTVNWWRTLDYEGTTISLIADEATLLYSAQTLEYSLEYEWIPELITEELPNFTSMHNTWLQTPLQERPNILSRIIIGG